MSLRGPLIFTFTRLADFPVAIFTITQKASFRVLAFLSERVAGIGGCAVAFIDIYREKNPTILNQQHFKHFSMSLCVITLRVDFVTYIVSYIPSKTIFIFNRTIAEKKHK